MTGRFLQCLCRIAGDGAAGLWPALLCPMEEQGKCTKIRRGLGGTWETQVLLTFRLTDSEKPIVLCQKTVLAAGAQVRRGAASVPAFLEKGGGEGCAS